MNELRITNNNLPDTINDLAQFALVGREKLVAVRAAIRAMDKVNAVAEVREQKLKEAQELAEAVLDAEVRLGELLSQLPESPGKRTDLLEPTDSAVPKSKKEIIESAGFSVKQAQRYERLATHPEEVEQAKASARNAGEIVSRTTVLKVISDNQKPFISNNSGDSEWYTPSRYIESARTVMGSIDLDPASCEEANRTVKAAEYYSAEDDGLLQTWTGNVWLNPPYSQVAKFIDKLLDSDIDQAIVLVNNATETQWFKQIAEQASAIIFHTGRLRFMKPGHIESAPMQGQCFIYLGNKPETFLSEFKQYGWGTLLR